MFAKYKPVPPRTAIGAQGYGAGVFKRAASPNTAKQIPRIAKPVLIAVPNVARIKCSVLRPPSTNMAAVATSEIDPTCQEK